jgi:hypothetical protein
MSKRFSIVHAGRRIEVEPGGGWTGTTVRLFVDGHEVAQAKGGRRVVVRAVGLEVRTWPVWHGERLTRAELLVDGDASTLPIALDPPAGTLAARREAFARRHPAIGAARHPAAGVGKVLLGLIGLSFLLRLIPDISIDLPLPAIHLPSIDLPLPSIHLPMLPDWLRAIVDSAKYWSPIVAGLGYGAADYRRWRRQRATDDAPQGAGGEPGGDRDRIAAREPAWGGAVAQRCSRALPTDLERSSGSRENAHRTSRRAGAAANLH